MPAREEGHVLVRRWLDVIWWLSRYGHWGKGWWQRWLSSPGLGQLARWREVPSSSAGKEGWDARFGRKAVTVLVPRRMTSWQRSGSSYPWESPKELWKIHTKRKLRFIKLHNSSSLNWIPEGYFGWFFCHRKGFQRCGCLQTAAVSLLTVRSVQVIGKWQIGNNHLWKSHLFFFSSAHQ